MEEYVGISPAQNRVWNMEKYKIAAGIYMDLINSTGSGYTEEIGSQPELLTPLMSVAGELERLMNLLSLLKTQADRRFEGDWPTDELIKKFWKNLIAGNGKVVYDKEFEKIGGKGYRLG